MGENEDRDRATSAAGEAALRAENQALRERVAELERWREEHTRDAESLREAKERAEQYLELAGVMFVGLGPDGTVRLVNRRACEVLGRPREEILGKNWFEHFIPAGLREEVARVQAAVFRGELEAVREYENPVLDAAGEPRLVEWKNAVLRDASGAIEATLSAGTDVTERKRLEAQIQHAQKLESLGVLAGGIAHDFNNLLVAILGNASLALEDTPPNSPARPSLEDIEEAARHASKLCQQMLAYSGHGAFVVRPVSLNELIGDMGHMLEISVSKKIVLRYDLAEPLPAVLADPAQLSQILLNLVINASEAIAERSGVISVRTGVMECDNQYLNTTFLNADLTAGTYVYLEVGDTGCGMEPHVQERMFDPFFSTKFTGRGLGMAATLGIVRGHHGAIKVYSEFQRGTTVKVLLPISDLDASPFEGRPPAPFPEGQAKGRVLLCDDEETVRAVGKRILERAGYDVVLAADGREAMERYREHEGELACVVLDLTMPHLDGEEVFRELRTLGSEVPVLLSSGYNADEVKERFLGKGLAGFVQKPYLPRTLLARIRQAIHGAEKSNSE